MLSVSITPNSTRLAQAFLKGSLNDFLKREVNRLTFSVERFAKQLTPVDTGRLRASIQATPFVLNIGAWVSTKTNYAVYVHEGTKYMRGRPFLTMGASFAQVAELKDINIRLDKEFTKEFKSL